MRRAAVAIRDDEVLPALYATDGVAPEQKVLHVKFFDPCGRGTWYVAEFDPKTRIAFGWCTSPLGADCDEWGYFELDELEATKNVLGLPMERDLHWTPIAFGQLDRDGQR